MDDPIFSSTLSEQLPRMLRDLRGPLTLDGGHVPFQNKMPEKLLRLDDADGCERGSHGLQNCGSTREGYLFWRHISLQQFSR